MIIYELSVDSIDATELLFPIPKEKELLLELIEDKISNGISVKNEWKEFIVLKREPKIDVDFYDIDDMGVCIFNQKAYDLLGPMFDESIEVLPLKSDDQNYYLK